jgi:hypothetical protein
MMEMVGYSLSIVTGEHCNVLCHMSRIDYVITELPIRATTSCSLEGTFTWQARICGLSNQEVVYSVRHCTPKPIFPHRDDGTGHSHTLCHTTRLNLGHSPMRLRTDHSNCYNIYKPTDNFPYTQKTYSQISYDYHVRELRDRRQR